MNQYAEFNHYINSPVARYKDELYNLPFNMNTFSKMWGLYTPEQVQAKIEEQRAEYIAQKKKERGLAPEEAFVPQNLEEQAISLAGTDIYEKLIREYLAGTDIYEKLIREYTQKQWGRPCTELPAFIIRRLPLRFTYDNNYFNDRYQGIPIGDSDRRVHADG